MDKNGVTDALESFKDTNSLRYKVYKALSEIDPYFDLNEKEYNALLARSDFSLDMIVAEIHGILVLGRVSKHPQSNHVCTKMGVVTRLGRRGGPSGGLSDSMAAHARR